MMLEDVCDMLSSLDFILYTIGIGELVKDFKSGYIIGWGRRKGHIRFLFYNNNLLFLWRWG